MHSAASVSPRRLSAPPSEADLLRAALRASCCDEPEDSLRGLAAGLQDNVPVQSILWLSPEAEVVAAWPMEVELSTEVRDLAAHAVHPESYSARSMGVEARFPGAELLMLPLGRSATGAGALLLAAPAGTLGEPAAWAPVAEGLAHVHARHAQLRDARDECDRLRKRAEEIEALDVLGLAANRTLDPDEVLALVARFTRTLLGADYAAVSTGEGGHLRACSAVGLHAPLPDSEDDPLARCVAEAGKPVYVGEGEELRVADFPFHAAEGMRAGMGVPLSLFGEHFGALVIGYREPYRVTRQDTRLAVTLARHAAVAISNAQLHRAVEERSRELESAYEQLRELTAVKERFFNTVSHELRTPINSLKGYGDLLLRGAAGPLPDRARLYLERSRAATLTLMELIDDLLDFAKLDAGRMEASLAPCSPREIMDAALAVAEPLAAARGLRLRSEAGEDPPVLRTDSRRVKQILTNLLSNAIKFTADGEVVLAARVDGEWMELRVADTGRGIPPEHLDRVFEEFAQVPGSEGTGLGLPISRKLARLLGGELRVESEVGVGSTFILRLPADFRLRPQDASTAA
ncbi:MAG TPA: GAF domain-containing sensor histidine kinase [Longimicrobium sp.]|jgi:signal transduction histidine kinase